jgi:hypothetical protein
MRMKRLLLICVVVLAAATAAFAQGALNEGQGHPLKGSWLGDWGTSRTNRTLVLIEMDWDGKVVTATLNPGPDAVRFTRAELDHANWAVHIEGMSAGARLVIDGKIENLGSARRFITGTWTQGNQKGDFKITRQ